ncbi:MAG: nickel pincer cofactor biosynthesis protein LarC [Melioribacteraceae bacterium]|nr:nickel pincer cofactor biosynthesis protein LarC [Melioribacteraceae bacterium]
MGHILKIEAFSGASGDMFLGAFAGLLDVYDELLKLPLLLNFADKAEIVIEETNKNGIVCKQVKVKELVHEHVHRHMSHIYEIIDKSELNANAKKISREIFEIIGRAESTVHGVPIEKIHFHEVGAVDSIIDVCGAAYLIDKLNIEKTYSSPLTTGKGFVKTAHGLLPVPCPATKLILEGLPCLEGDEEGERLTPTGAAIIKYLNPIFKSVPLIDKKTSYGSGEKEFTAPNVLRLSISELSVTEKEMIIIETNIDDYNSEYLGWEFQNQLLAKGALDFYFTQIIMKKGRPGLLITILCYEENLPKLKEFVFKNTSSIGLRYYRTNKIQLERKIDNVETEFGKFNVKSSIIDGNTSKVKPEADEVLKYSFENNISPQKVSQKVLESYNKKD